MATINRNDGTTIFYKDWVADSAPLSAKLLKNSTLKVYEKLPRGMCTTHADVINSDLLAFIRG